MSSQIMQILWYSEYGYLREVVEPRMPLTDCRLWVRLHFGLSLHCAILTVHLVCVPGMRFFLLDADGPCLVGFSEMIGTLHLVLDWVSLACGGPVDWVLNG